MREHEDVFHLSGHHILALHRMEQGAAVDIQNNPKAGPIFERLRTTPHQNIKVVVGADDICTVSSDFDQAVGQCAHQMVTCQLERIMDKAHVLFYGYRVGEQTTMEELRSRLQRIPLDREHETYLEAHLRVAYMMGEL